MPPSPGPQLSMLPPEPPKLTRRQEVALAYISRNGPVEHDALGAVLHQLRRDDGGKGHDAESRCEWCLAEGSTMGRSLADLGLVTWRRARPDNSTRGWVLPGTQEGGPGPGHDPSTAPIPY
jgi:hypothetical protein